MSRSSTSTVMEFCSVTQRCSKNNCTLDLFVSISKDMDDCALHFTQGALGGKANISGDTSRYKNKKKKYYVNIDLAMLCLQVNAR